MFYLVRVTALVRWRRYMIMEEWRNGDKWGKNRKDSVKNFVQQESYTKLPGIESEKSRRKSGTYKPQP